MNRKTKLAVVTDASQRRAPVRVRSRKITAVSAKLYPPDGEGRIWWDRLKRGLGAQSSDFVNASLRQLQAAAQFPGSGICEVGINAALAMIEGLRHRMRWTGMVQRAQRFLVRLELAISVPHPPQLCTDIHRLSG